MMGTVLKSVELDVFVIVENSEIRQQESVCPKTNVQASTIPFTPQLVKLLVRTSIADFGYFHKYKLLILLNLSESDQCPSENETFALCGRAYGDSCALHRNNQIVLSDFCLSPRCQCKANYYRHPTNYACVPKDDCPLASEFKYSRCSEPETLSDLICTDPFETYTDCGPSCGDDSCILKPASYSSCRQECKRGE